jgi:chaperonin GroES
MSLRPLHDRIVVRRMEEGESMRGGLYIPDSAKEKPQQGEVLAAGAGRLDKSGKRIALEVKAGDKVLFGKYSGNDVKIDGQDALIMREDEVLAILG